jgi:hypothetical protein
MEIERLAPSMTGVTVDGTVVELSPPRTVRTKHGQLTTLATALLADGSHMIKLTLWGAQVQQVKRGSRIRIVSGFTSVYEGELVLQIGRSGRIEELGPQDRHSSVGNDTTGGQASAMTKWIPQNPEKRYENGKLSWWAEQVRRGHIIEWEFNEAGYTGRVRLDGEILLKEHARQRLQTSSLSQTALKNEAYSSLQELELALNGLVQRQLSRLNSDWWRMRIPDDIREEAERRKERDHKPWGWYKVPDLHLIHYLTFADYAKVIGKNDNWRDAFAEVFGDREIVLTRLRELEPIRNIVMHPSKPLSVDQLERLRLYAKDIMSAMSSREPLS